MRRGVLVSVIGLTIVAGVSVGSLPARCETVGCGPELVQETSRKINETLASIKAACREGRVDDALGQLGEITKWPLAPDGAEARLLIATELRKLRRSSEAAELLKATAKNDPYNRCTPDSLALLSSILYYDLNDRNSYGEYLSKLAMDYYPEIPVVQQARAAYGQNPPEAPKTKKILLDESLKEASIFGRFFLGSSNFCQWDVIRTLGAAGYTVHDNGWKSNATLTLDVMNQYGLVIMNGGSSEKDAAIPQQAINNIVEYVKGGGSLLIVCASKTLGRNCEPQYYNPLMAQFQMSFDTDYTTGGGTVMCTPGDHPAMNGVKEFQATFGTRITGGTSIGKYKEDTLVAVKQVGRGTVIAADIGTGFMGNTIGDLYRNTEKQKAEAQINRQFVLKLAQYLLMPSGKSLH